MLFIFLPDRSQILKRQIQMSPKCRNQLKVFLYRVGLEKEQKK